MCKPYSHIAPELHGGDRQSKASDVYSFGAKAQHVLKDGNCTRVVKKCLSLTPGKCPQNKRCFKRTGMAHFLDDHLFWSVKLTGSTVKPHLKAVP